MLPRFLAVRCMVRSLIFLLAEHHVSMCSLQVKFTDLTLDTFRMLQCLEWEPCGSFAQNNGYSAHDEGGQNHPNLLKDLRDAALPPNPLKTVLYRPSVPHFLKVSFSFGILSTQCLIYCLRPEYTHCSLLLNALVWS